MTSRGLVSYKPNSSPCALSHLDGSTALTAEVRELVRVETCSATVGHSILLWSSLSIPHIPFLYVLRNFSWTRHPNTNVTLTSILLLIRSRVDVAWLALKLYHEPVPCPAKPSLRSQAGSGIVPTAREA
jgi:hypothetical protein